MLDQDRASYLDAPVVSPHRCNNGSSRFERRAHAFAKWLLTEPAFAAMIRAGSERHVFEE